MNRKREQRFKRARGGREMILSETGEQGTGADREMGGFNPLFSPPSPPPPPPLIQTGYTVAVQNFNNLGVDQ